MPLPWVSAPYNPIPCSNAGGEAYRKVCHGMVDKDRRGFSVCVGCVESYSLNMLPREDRYTFDEIIFLVRLEDEDY